MSKNNNTVPVALVKTWYELLLNAEETEAKNHARDMLLGAFGTEANILAYLKKHKIIG